MILSSTDEGHVLLGLPSIERQTSIGNPSTTTPGSSKVIVMSVVRDGCQYQSNRVHRGALLSVSSIVTSFLTPLSRIRRSWLGRVLSEMENLSSRSRDISSNTVTFLHTLLLQPSKVMFVVMALWSLDAVGSRGEGDVGKQLLIDEITHLLLRDSV